MTDISFATSQIYDAWVHRKSEHLRQMMYRHGMTHTTIPHLFILIGFLRGLGEVDIIKKMIYGVRQGSPSLLNLYMQFLFVGTSDDVEKEKIVEEYLKDCIRDVKHGVNFEDRNSVRAAIETLYRINDIYVLGIVTSTITMYTILYYRNLFENKRTGEILYNVTSYMINPHVFNTKEKIHSLYEKRTNQWFYPSSQRLTNKNILKHVHAVLQLIKNPSIKLRLPSNSKCVYDEYRLLMGSGSSPLPNLENMNITSSHQQTKRKALESSHDDNNNVSEPPTKKLSKVEEEKEPITTTDSVLGGYYNTTRHRHMCKTQKKNKVKVRK